MLTGILTPTSGTARVLGLDPAKNRTRLAMEIGAVFGQKSQLWFHLPPSDSFRLLGAIYEVPSGELARRRADVVVKREIRALLAELRARDGVTIFLTSRDIGDIEKICKRAIIIYHGAVVVDESMKTLKHRALARKYIGVKYASPANLDLPGLTPLKHTEDAGSFVVDTRKHNLQEVIRALVDRGEVLDLTVEDEPLEDIIAEVFRGGTGPERLALFTLLALSGAVIFAAVFSAAESLTFFLGNTGSLSQALTEFLLSFSLYPETVFDPGMRWIFYTLLPSGFIAFVPLAVYRNLDWPLVPVLLAAALVYAAGAGRPLSENG